VKPKLQEVPAVKPSQEGVTKMKKETPAVMSSAASPTQAAPAAAPTAPAPVDSPAAAKTETVAAVPITSSPPVSVSPPPAAPPASGVPPQAAAVAPPAAVAAKPPSTESVRLKEFVVYFTQNSTEVPIYANDILSNTANLLKSFPESQALIEGHTDSIGDPAYNRFISAERAASVRNYLIGQGIEARRLAASGLGPEKPIESNSTPEGRSKNRRVVIRIVTGKQG
jgi:OOP family OmpA-OmpF porin